MSAGQRLSLQSHRLRADTWFVVSGEGVVSRDDAAHRGSSRASIDIGTGMRHRIESTGSGALVFIEVQHGTSFGEDDIVRHEDDYGRTAVAEVLAGL